MNKADFFNELQQLLKALPKAERQQHIDYYEEMINDRMEDGLREEEAVAALGSASDIATQILSELPQKPARQFPVWGIVLIVVGSPLWLSLLLTAVFALISIITVVAAVYISLWAAIVALYATDLGLLLGFLGGLIGSVSYFIQGIPTPGIAFLGGALVCAGCTVLLFFLCNLLSKLLWKLGRWALLKTVGMIRRKGGK